LDLPLPGRRRVFTEELKRQIVEETCRPGASVSGVARRYGIASSMLFRWRDALGLGASSASATFAPVEIVDEPEAVAGLPMVVREPAPAPPTIVVERLGPAMEIELIGGRKLRVERDIDPEIVCRLVAALEGTSP
jgi:transposase